MNDAPTTALKYGPLNLHLQSVSSYRKRRGPRCESVCEGSLYFTTRVRRCIPVETVGSFLEGIKAYGYVY